MKHSWNYIAHTSISLGILDDNGLTTTIAEEFYTNYLHGELIIQIVKAEGLSNMDHGSKLYGCENLGECMSIKRFFTFSKNLSDPFVSIHLGQSCVCKTSWKDDR